MKNPTVLITGALTGIGRATALAFAHEAPTSSSPAAAKRLDSNWPPNCGSSA